MRVTTTLGMCGLVLLLLASAALSQVGAQGAVSRDDYQLEGWAVSPGGSAAGGPYTMECAAGLPDAGELSSDRYTLVGGLWGGDGRPLWHSVYLPILVRQ
jgi:hypothetical protein